ncbi:MAG: tetratricopeptide repeat protein [Deltaproteobacteria bacterium]
MPYLLLVFILAALPRPLSTAFAGDTETQAINNGNGQEDGLPANGAMPEAVANAMGGETPKGRDLSEVGLALSKDDLDSVIKLIPPILEADKDKGQMLLPVLAYAYGKKGETAAARGLLVGRTDTNSLLAMAGLTGETIIPPGMKEPASGVEMFYANISVRKSNAINKALYKKALTQALKKAFLKRAVNAGDKDMKAFEEKMLPRAKDYYLSHYALTYKEVEDYYSYGVVVFIDGGRLDRDMGLFSPASRAVLRIKLMHGKGALYAGKALLKDLIDSGFSVEDMGAIDPGGETNGRTKGAIVIQVNEARSKSANVMGSKFKSIEGSIDVAILNGNNGLVIARISKADTVVHLSEEDGLVIAMKKAYEKLLSPLKDTIAHIEATMGKDIASGALPPIEMQAGSVRDVFSNMYKFYSEEPILLLSIRNNTAEAYGKIKISLSVKGYMDYPTEVLLEGLGAKEERVVPLKAVFNNSILDLTENTLLQSEIDLSYNEGGVVKGLKMRQPVQVYEKHALVWDDKGKIASFLTAKDPVVMEFATKAVREYNYPEMNQAMVKARAIFGAMGALGITYAPDPTPYSMASSVANIVDYAQFPRETLTRKAGDCDDLVSLFGASLKSLGVEVVPIEAPGHLFLMFDAGISAEDEALFGFQRDMYVVYDNRVWVPVETTLAGSSFTLAWMKGAENAVRWKDQARFVDLAKVWSTYGQPTLPPAEFRQDVSKNDIEQKFPGELEGLQKKRGEFLAGMFAQGGVSGLKQMLIIYGRNNMLKEALQIADELMSKAVLDPEALNNIGNIYFLNGEFERAVSAYASALNSSPNDPGILVNIARTYLRAGNLKEAREAFKKALSIDADIKYKYLKLYTEIGF